MPVRKISDTQLERLVRQGYGVSEIARKLNVTKGAVSRAIKRMDHAVTKDISLRSAPDVVKRKLDAMDQLSRINASINSELDYIEGEIKGSSDEKRVNLQNQKLKHTAEIRKQMRLLLDIVTTMYNAEEIAAFQKIVLEEISNASPEVKHKILQRLQQRRAIRSSVSFP